MIEKLIIAVILMFTICTQAQTFEEKTSTITKRIDSITLAEKGLLKDEIKKVDKALKNKKISYEEAEIEKQRLADYYAKRIQLGVNHEKEKLESIIAKRVDDQIAGKVNDTISDDSQGKNFHISINKKEDGDEWSEVRTTSQLVFAVGVNTLQSADSEINDHLNTWSSRFWEFGYTRNTRLSEESNLLHLKYGLSLLYNNYKPKDNKVFTTVDGQTVLADTSINFDRNRFRNFYLNVPVHLEFDLSPIKYSEEGKKLYRSHKSFRFGIGGYGGVLVNSRNFFKYKENGKKIKTNKKDDYNVNAFNYGLSAYVGYKQLSLYTKYDLKPLFEDNLAEDQNISIGLRWDIN
ncbi:MAG: hypothetical protein ACR2MS_01175 [Weeksellaceae bacterium]